REVEEPRDPLQGAADDRADDLDGELLGPREPRARGRDVLPGCPAREEAAVRYPRARAEGEAGGGEARQVEGARGHDARPAGGGRGSLRSRGDRRGRGSGGSEE